MPSVKEIFGSDWDLFQTADGSSPWDLMVKSEDGGSLSPPEVEVHPSRQAAGDDTLRANSPVRKGIIVPDDCLHSDCLFELVCPGYPKPTQSGKKTHLGS